jgi:hypothetical protein
LTVLPDTGGLFEDHPPVRRPAGDDRRDLSLLDNGVAPDADSGVHEEVEDVAQPARHLVNLVFALAGPIETARDLDLGKA